MRKITAGLFISLDGAVEAPDQAPLTSFPRLLVKTAVKYSPGQQTMAPGASIRVYLGN